MGREVQAIAGQNNVLVVPTDVSDIAQVQALKDRVLDTWGEVCSLSSMALRRCDHFSTSFLFHIFFFFYILFPLFR